MGTEPRVRRKLFMGISEAELNLRRAVPVVLRRVGHRIRAQRAQRKKTDNKRPCGCDKGTKARSLRANMGARRLAFLSSAIATAPKF
jgi:hypothetical protein